MEFKENVNENNSKVILLFLKLFKVKKIILNKVLGSEYFLRVVGENINYYSVFRKELEI